MDGLSSSGKAAWKTRRKKYGPKGHAGHYRRSDPTRIARIVARLRQQGDEDHR